MNNQKHICPNCNHSRWKTVSKQTRENGIIILGKGRQVECRTCGYLFHGKAVNHVNSDLSLKGVMDFAKNKAKEILDSKKDSGVRLKRKGRFAKEIAKDAYAIRGVKHFGTFSPLVKFNF